MANRLFNVLPRSNTTDTREPPTLTYPCSLHIHATQFLRQPQVCNRLPPTLPPISFPILNLSRLLCSSALQRLSILLVGIILIFCLVLVNFLSALPRGYSILHLSHVTPYGNIYLVHDHYILHTANTRSDSHQSYSDSTAFSCSSTSSTRALCFCS